jgi:hypothetical protein
VTAGTVLAIEGQNCRIVSDQWKLEIPVFHYAEQELVGVTILGSNGMRVRFTHQDGGWVAVVRDNGTGKVRVFDRTGDVGFRAVSTRDKDFGQFPAACDVVLTTGTLRWVGVVGEGPHVTSTVVSLGAW